jgi:hypothetical protein
MFGAGRIQAQAPASTPKPEPDVLIFNNGEKLIGHLVRAHGASVVFKSDTLGEVTVDWSKVKELHAAEKFAVIGKNVVLGRHPDPSTIPQGTISESDQKLELQPATGAPQTMPVGDVGHVVDEPTLQRALHHGSFIEGWKGSLTGGATIVQATQDNRTFTGAVNLVRGIPSENWLDPRNRTIFDFSAAYGLLQQPNTPEVKTNIIHFDAERDEYFSSRLYGFGQATFDHNFSQGLSLEQTYSGGIGWTALKRANEELDFKGSATYIRQQFEGSTESKDLIGSIFGETYNRKFKRGLIFLQGVSVTPAWNDTNAYTATGFASLTMPVYKRLNFTTGAIDNFLNDPPPGFKKNSLQFTLGVTYTLP